MALTANTQASGTGSGGVGGTLRAGLEKIYKLGLSFIFFFQLLKDFILFSGQIKVSVFHLMHMLLQADEGSQTATHTYSARTNCHHD